MSTRVEWLEARYASAEIAQWGEPLGDANVTAEFALVFGADDFVVIEGSAAELVQYLDLARERLVRRLPKCPTCGRPLLEGGRHT